MRSRFPAVLACGAGIAIVVAGGAPARIAADTIQLRALMNPTDEVPAPSGSVSDARGTFTARATKTATGASLEWRMTFTDLTGPAVAAHLHTAARGVAGPVSLSLCGPCTSPVTGTAEIDAALLSAIQNDGVYANVHTPTNPRGEIRAQVSSLASVRTVLSAGQEVPKPKGVRRGATGRFVLTAVKSGSSAVVTWRLTFSRLSGRAVAAHIHTGRRGAAGPVAVPLCGPCANGATGRATVNATTLAALESGRTYVNVHTARNPAGEIRGQVPATALTITP